MIQKIDMESDEFKAEMAKTKEFTDKVINQFSLAYNPDEGVNESVIMGLTRHKMIYGKRFCPCFMVTQTEEDRICPCQPALKEEIPNEGKCHCGIFCSADYRQ